MRLAVDFDVSALEDVRHQLSGWLESAEAGDMNGDEMLSKLAGIAGDLEDAAIALRRALGR